MIRPLVRSILSRRFTSLRVKYHILGISNKELRFRQSIKIILIGNSINIITFKEIISILTHVQILSTTNTMVIEKSRCFSLTTNFLSDVVIDIPTRNLVEEGSIFNELICRIYVFVRTKDSTYSNNIVSVIVCRFNSRIDIQKIEYLFKSSLNLLMLLTHRIIQVKSISIIRFVLSKTSIRNTSTRSICISKVHLCTLHIIKLNTIDRFF